MAIQQSDLKIGMYLVNAGKTFIPVYASSEGKGEILLSIKPGEQIGQITDFGTGAKGTTITVTSEAIHEAAKKSSILAKMGYYTMFLFVPGGLGYIAGIINFADVKNNLSPVQISEQNTAMKKAEEDGASFANSFKKVVSKTGEVLAEAAEAAESAIPWKLVGGAAAVYVLLNWNKFVKPR